MYHFKLCIIQSIIQNYIKFHPKYIKTNKFHNWEAAVEGPGAAGWEYIKVAASWDEIEAAAG